MLLIYLFFLHLSQKHYSDIFQTAMIKKSHVVIFPVAHLAWKVASV